MCQTKHFLMCHQASFCVLLPSFLPTFRAFPFIPYIWFSSLGSAINIKPKECSPSFPFHPFYFPFCRCQRCFSFIPAHFPVFLLFRCDYASLYVPVCPSIIPPSRYLCFFQEASLFLSHHLSPRFPLHSALMKPIHCGPDLALVGSFAFLTIYHHCLPSHKT